MSQDTREKVLSAAVAVAASDGADAVIAAAKKFEAYITGADAAKPGPEPKTVKTAEKPTVEKAKPVTKPAVEKAKPVATKAPKKDEIDPDLKKLVGDKVNELLKANLRDEVVELLASFEGAQSATGIVTQGQEVIDSFMEQADSLLAAAVEAGCLAD